ncbi:3-keto-steroid reductase/17-beta-hydroxysteroid dehydrogenase 7-like [Watersipora subatra]|uniref:3-keto-steroid reductase/17-beta-hydroxysteroid dehydrogenase 7-like n=1 Tax=Watersipora subatra TaxID=2589382 RepID=UPI00355C64CA
MESITAIVTGANSGVGFALCNRLLDDFSNMRLCIICRNEQRGTDALNALLTTHSGAAITLVLCDIGCISSVKKCCQEIRKLYKHIDFLFLNAGIMANPKVKVATVFTTLLQPSKLIHRFSTGSDLLLIDDSTTNEGFKSTFATNVLGHFYMVKELNEVLGGVKPSRIVWTSSRMASKDKFTIDDIQHESGIDPYASSKYLIDALSISMNDKLRDKNITAATTCPGMMRSGLSLGILSWWIWFLLAPIVKLLRLFIPAFTWEPTIGAEAMVWLSKQTASSLDPRVKYYSMCSFFGNPYTTTSKMDIDSEIADRAYTKLEEILEAHHSSQQSASACS